MKSDEEILMLCDAARQTCFDIHVYFKPGFLEKIYQKALAHRLETAGHRVIEQAPLIVRDKDGTPVGEYFADLIVGDCLIIEIKTCKGLADEHIAQIFGSLRASRTIHGLLVNFGTAKLEIRKFAVTPKS